MKKFFKVIAKIILIIIIFILLFTIPVSYILYKKIYNPKYLKNYFIKVISKILESKVIPPDLIDFSLLNNRILIKNWKILDKKQKIFLKIPKAIIKFKRLLFYPKIEFIKIYNPSLILYEDKERKCLNCFIFKHQKKISKKSSKQGILIEKYLYKKAFIEIVNGKIDIILPKYYSKEFIIDKINLKIQRKYKRGFLYLKKSQNIYQINISLFTNITKKFLIKGILKNKKELYLKGSNFSFSLNKFSNYIPILKENNIELKGKIKICDLEISYLIDKNKKFDISAQISHKNGRICIKDYCILLDNIQTKFSLKDKKITNLCMCSNFNKGEIEIYNAKIGILNKTLFIPFRINGLKLNSQLLDIIKIILENKLKSKNNRKKGKKNKEKENIKKIKEIKYILENTDIRGEINIEGKIYKEKNKNLEYIIKTKITNTNIIYVPKKWKIENINIHTQIEKNKFIIKKLKFRLLNGKFNINHDIYIEKYIENNQNKIKTNLEIYFKNLKLTKKFLTSHYFLKKNIWDNLHPQGYIDGKIILKTSDIRKNFLPLIEITPYNLYAKFIEIPYPVRIKKAKLIFKEGKLKIEYIKGKSISCNANIYINGDVFLLEHPYPIAYDIKFKIDNLELNKQAYSTFDVKWKNSWHLDIKSIWDYLNPSGNLTLEGHVKKRRKDYTLPIYNILIKLNKINAFYKDYPYPIYNAKGEIIAQRLKFNTSKGKVIIKEVKGEKEKGKLEVKGEIKTGGKELGINIKIKGGDIKIDKDIKKVIGEDYAKIIDDFSLKGKIDVEINLKKTEKDKKLKWNALVNLKDCSAKYKIIPYYVKKIKGILKIKPNIFILENIHSYEKNKEIKALGKIKDKNLKIIIFLKNIPLDKKLYHALPKEVQKIWKNFKIKGKTNGKIIIKKDKKHKKINWKIIAKFKNIQGLYKPFPYSLKNIQGEIIFTKKKIEIKRCESIEGEKRVKIKGEITKDINITIKAKNLKLNKKLYKALSKQHKKIWNMFKPRGIINAKINITKKQKKKIKTIIKIIPINCSIRYKEFPYKLTQISIKNNLNNHNFNNNDPILITLVKSGIIIKDNIIEFNNLETLDRKIQLKGYFYNKLGKNKKDSILKLIIKTKDLNIDKNLRIALKKKFPNLIKSLTPQGKIKSLKFILEKYKVNNIDYSNFRIKIKDLKSTMKNKFLKKLQGDIEIQGMQYKKNFHLNGEINNGKIKLKKVVINNIKSHIKYFNQYLVFPDLKGKFYDGDIKSILVFDTSLYGAYKGYINFKNASLKKLIQDLQKKEKKKNSKKEETLKKQEKLDISALLEGNLSFQGNLHSLDFLTGKGKIKISKGKIWRLPLFLAILDIFSLPSAPALREGYIEYSIANKLININQLFFSSSVLNIAGTGVVDFDTNIDLTLTTHFTSNIIPRLPLLDNIWTGISKNIFSLKVSGTLEKPIISLKPWYNIKTFLGY